MGATFLLLPDHPKRLGFRYEGIGDAGGCTLQFTFVKILCLPVRREFLECIYTGTRSAKVMNKMQVPAPARKKG